MPHFDTSTATAEYRGHNEDRAAVFQDAERTVIVVVDGAGGSGAGAAAAEDVLREVRLAFPHISSSADWERALWQADARIGDGEAAAVVVDLRPDRICGASVGDCVAWVLADEALLDLTGKQIRKPLLGSRESRPVGFDGSPLSGTLLVASDGFATYVKRDRLLPLPGRTDFWTLPQACLQLVQLPSGAWWDDTTVVACRVQPRTRTRQKYEI